MQSAHIRKLKTLVGPRLARVRADEPYLSLLHLLGDLQEVAIYTLSDSYTHPINVVALAALPTLHTLEVSGTYTTTTIVQYVQELTQLKCLRLVNMMPNELPQNLKVLDMQTNSVESLHPAAPPCSPLLEGFRGSLDVLALGRFIRQFDFDPGRLAAFSCLQQLTSLSLDFDRFSAEACQLTFPHLLSLKIRVREFGVHYAPFWNLIGCPQLQHVTIIVDTFCNDVMDLSRILNLHSACLRIQIDVRGPDVRRHVPGAYSGALNTIAVKLNAATWALHSVEILTPAGAPQVWQDCGRCVQEMLQALLGHVRFSNISINGVLSSAILDEAKAGQHCLNRRS